MASRYDVVVVGARCAGSPLAIHLARAGLSVALVDRATFPSDTASTHVLESEGVACLRRLGVLDRAMASGAPWIDQVDMRHGDVRMTADMPAHDGVPGPWVCVRRLLLDAILAEAAAEAGADLRTATSVVGIVREGGRVAGVRVRTGDGDGEEELRATLVVGADGMGSTVAGLVGSRQYHVVPNERFGYWCYYEGAEWAPPAALVFHRWDEDLVLACPADSGLYLAIVIPPLRELAAFRADPDASFEAAVRRCPPAWAAVAPAERVGRLHTAVTYPAFFRESAGPGWVLVGDAGHFKDPTPGQGISDALRQVERLAPAIVEGLGVPGRIDRAMAKWWRWRDADAREMHWLAADLGKAGPMPAVSYEMIRRIGATAGGRGRMVDVMNHRIPPSKVLSPARLMTTTAELVLTGELGRRAVLGQAAGLVKDDLRHRALGRRPVYAPTPSTLLRAEVVVDGLRSPTLEGGPDGAGEAVVFVHGNPGSSEDWVGLAEAVSGFAAVLAPDMPGYGGADKPASFSYTVEGYAAHLGRLLEQRGVRRAHLVVHDFGGPWALAWAAAHPEAVASVVLIGTGVLVDYHWHWLARIWRTPIGGEVFMATSNRPAFRLVLRQGNIRRALPRAFLDRMYDDFDRRTRRAVLRLYRATPDPSGLGRGQAAVLRPLDLPALVVWGGRDPYLPVVQAERQRETFPSAEVVVLPDSGHWPFVDDPDGVADAVVGFLRRQFATESVRSE